MYNEKVLHILTHTKNVGSLKGANGVAEITDAISGDVVKLHLKIENNRVEDAKYKVFGSVSTIVCANVVTQMVKGKTLEEVSKINENSIFDFVGDLPDDKKYSALLVVSTLHNTLEKYQKFLEKNELMN